MAGTLRGPLNATELGPLSTLLLAWDAATPSGDMPMLLPEAHVARANVGMLRPLVAPTFLPLLRALTSPLAYERLGRAAMTSIQRRLHRLARPDGVRVGSVEVWNTELLPLQTALEDEVSGLGVRWACLHVWPARGLLLHCFTFSCLPDKALDDGEAPVLALRFDARPMTPIISPTDGTLCEGPGSGAWSIVPWTGKVHEMPRRGMQGPGGAEPWYTCLAPVHGLRWTGAALVDPDAVLPALEHMTHYLPLDKLAVSL